jgi:hypothetical protein
MDAQTEIDRLRAENAELRKKLNDKQQLDLPKPLTALRNNFEFLTDMARFSEALTGYSEHNIRRRWRFSEADWTALATDDELVRIIENEKLRRVRDGSAKREKAQAHIVRGPDRLATVMDDPRANARHVVDSIKCLNDLADPGAQRALDSEDRVQVTIILNADDKSDANTKITFNKSIKPNLNDRDPLNDPIPEFLIEAKKDDGNDNPL